MWEFSALRILGKIPSGPALLWGLRSSRLYSTPDFQFGNERVSHVGLCTWLKYGSWPLILSAPILLPPQIDSGLSVVSRFKLPIYDKRVRKLNIGLRRPLSHIFNAVDIAKATLSQIFSNYSIFILVYADGASMMTQLAYTWPATLLPSCFRASRACHLTHTLSSCENMPIMRTSQEPVNRQHTMLSSITDIIIISGGILSGQ